MPILRDPIRLAEDAGLCRFVTMEHWILDR
jgi:hypothetical protein